MAIANPYSRHADRDAHAAIGGIIDGRPERRPWVALPSMAGGMGGMTSPSPTATAAPAAVKPSATAKRFERDVRGAADGSTTPYATLMAIAASESSRRPSAVNARSSAAGAFQFTEQTWLELVHRHGARLGAGDLAAQVIHRNGRYETAEPEWREAILRRRHDTALAARLAAAYCDDNRTTLSQLLGRPATEAEVLMAYLLGPRAAIRLVTAAETRPDVSVAKILPRALAANPDLLAEKDKPVSAHRALSLLTGRYAAEIAAAATASPPPPAHVTGQYRRAAGLAKERGR